MTFAAATSDGTKVWSIPVRLHAATFIGGSLCRSWAVQNLPAQQNLVDSLLFSANIDLNRWFWWHLSSIYSLPVQICFFQKPIDMPAWYGVTGRQESSASPDGPSGTEAAKWYANALACVFDFCLARDKPPCRSRSSTPKCRDLST